MRANSNSTPGAATPDDDALLREAIA
ncbi:nucleoside deaminase, partial [Bordetella pertussis]